MKYPVRTIRRRKSLAKRRKREEYKLAKKAIRKKLIEKYSSGVTTVPAIAKFDFENDYRVKKNNLRMMYYGY